MGPNCLGVYNSEGVRHHAHLKRMAFFDESAIRTASITSAVTARLKREGWRRSSPSSAAPSRSIERLCWSYAKWAESTPHDFRFAVKIPRTITHEHQLRRVRVPLQRFLRETDGLGGKRGPLLIQLPPSHSFDARLAGRFLELLRREYHGAVVCEPRHETWFSSRADALLVRFDVARVAADPPPTVGADTPGGWAGLVYYRLHGAPRKYWSKYGASDLRGLENSLHTASPAVDAWCVFDNTASGAAFENAFELSEVLGIVGS
jgi:uncharacterized protein YecE (DUF72 family)